MPQLSTLLNLLPAVSTVRMEGSGIALWVCWPGDLDQTVPQTLQDYGGMRLVEGTDQDLWFFFSPDVLLAMARLDTWGRFNSKNLVLQAIPAKIQVGYGSRDITLQIESSLTQQSIVASAGMQLQVHPQIREDIIGVPGLTFPQAGTVAGAAQLHWLGILSDARMHMHPTLAWYSILKPLGNPLDKGFQTGWRDFFGEVENILKRYKLKYILSDNFLIFPLDSLTIAWRLLTKSNVEISAFPPMFTVPILLPTANIKLEISASPPMFAVPVELFATP